MRTKTMKQPEPDSGGMRAVLCGGPLDGAEMRLPRGSTDVSVDEWHWTREKGGAEPTRFLLRERRWRIGYHGTETIRRVVVTVWASDLESALGKARAMASAALGVPEAELEAPVAEEVGS